LRRPVAETQQLRVRAPFPGVFLGPTFALSGIDREVVMASVAVWIDHKEAKLFRFDTAGVKQETLHAAHHLHHNGKDQAKKNDASALFNDLAKHLEGATEVLLLGPGTARTQFVHHLETHHRGDIGAKVVGNEACDHPTDKQVMALARKFFKKVHALA
jgi:hypothetical protein